MQLIMSLMWPELDMKKYGHANELYICLELYMKNVHPRVVWLMDGQLGLPP